MKVADFIRDYLRPIGAVLLRKDGDHLVYRLPNGLIFTLPQGGHHRDVKTYQLARLRNLLAKPDRSAPRGS